MVNSDKLKGIMREKRMTQADAAKLLGLSECSVNQKINNVRPFFLDEAEKLANALEIDSGGFSVYFFASQVAKCNIEFSKNKIITEKKMKYERPNPNPLRQRRPPDSIRTGTARSTGRKRKICRLVQAYVRVRLFRGKGLLLIFER